MKPRRTVESTNVLTLPGGNEDSDLWFAHCEAEDGSHVFRSVWELTEEDRKAIAGGANIFLEVWGGGHPPVTLGVTDIQLGRPKS